MENKLTFDSAIEILEITNITKVEISDLSRIVKKAKSRWHPDRVARFQDETEIDKHTKSFQLIEPAAELIKSYLNGEYKIGDKYEQKQERVYEEPSEVIRKNAVHIQDMLKKVWEGIKSTKYKHVEREQVLSDGFSLRELLNQDFKEDLVIPSLISFIFGPLALIIPIIIAAVINEVLGIIAVSFLGIHLIFCLLGFLPISRFWLPDFLVPIMLWFIDFGVGFYFKLSDREDNNWAKFFLAIPYWLALAVKYLVLFPINEIAKLFIGDKTVGVVKERANYYAGLADWYIDEITTKNHQEMNEQELFDLSYLYKEFKGFNAI
jgi:hypothetical protein